MSETGRKFSEKGYAIPLIEKTVMIGTVENLSERGLTKVYPLSRTNLNA